MAAHLQSCATANTPPTDLPRERLTAAFTVIVPMLGFGVAVWLLWGRLISSVELILCFTLYTVSALGVAAGYHRLFTHRSFDAPAPVRVLLGIAGSTAAQGPIFYWVAVHRKHHRHSDRLGDPHSPHHAKSGPFSILRGAWHAHVGWMLMARTGVLYRRVPDLLRDRAASFVNRFYLLWVVLAILLPGLVTAWVRGSWMGLLTGMLWGGFARIFLLHHVTWSINSICHLCGSAPYATNDYSRNNFVCAALAFGEGWHNNHHAFPTSARHGFHWWQIDGAYLLVLLLRRLGIASNIQLPDPSHRERKSSNEQTK